MKGRQAGMRRRRTPRLISPFLRRSMPARPISIVVACVWMRCLWVGCWFLSPDVVSGVGVEVELVSLEVQLKLHPTRSLDFLTFLLSHTRPPVSMFLQQSFASLRQSFEAGDLASVGQQLPPLKVRPRSISFPTLPSSCPCNICSEARRAILQT